ncbi:EMB2076 [Symbiodinium sp. CCMP2456]|nr:EMB2076 [Symbiodinium sp. CCMP2456]
MEVRDGSLLQKLSEAPDAGSIAEQLRQEACGKLKSLAEYSPAIRACGKHSAWQCAVWLLGAEEQQKSPAALASYTACISACGKGFAWAAAWSLLQVMLQKRAEPNVYTCSAAVSACVEPNIVSFGQSRCQANVFIYNAAVRAPSTARQWEHATDILYWLHSSGIKRNIEDLPRGDIIMGDVKGLPKSAVSHRSYLDAAMKDEPVSANAAGFMKSSSQLS